MGVSFKVSKTGARYRPKPQANDGAVVADDEPESNSKESSRKQQVTKKKKKSYVKWIEFIWLVTLDWFPGKREGNWRSGELGILGIGFQLGFVWKSWDFWFWCVYLYVYIELVVLSSAECSYIYISMGMVETEIWDMNLLSFGCWHFLVWTIEVCVINWESVWILRK